MKSKKNIYFLLPAVLLIWGIIGYKIYVTLYSSDDVMLDKSTSVYFNPEEIKEVEKFTIQANYRDPFLGKTYSGNTPSKGSEITNQKTTVNTAFPQIVYKGMIAPKKTSRSIVFFVSINNVEQFLSIGKEMEGVKLLGGDSKKIEVRFQNVKKTIPIQQ